MSDDVLEREIRSLAGQLAAASYAWLGMIAEFDRRSAWSGWGLKSCAHWLAWSCSLSPAAAREHVRVARALPALPLVSEEFAKGSLSYSKVRALTRVSALVDEQTLVNLALIETAGQLERTVRGFRRAHGTGLDQQRARRARAYWDTDGMLVFSARLTADEGAIVMAALAAAQHETEPPSAEERLREADEADRVDINRALTVADGMVWMANAALAAQSADTSGDDRNLVILHRTAPDQKPDQEQPEQEQRLCRLEDGPGLDETTGERLACDSAVIEITKNSPNGILDVGRKTRKISPALRRALRFRDVGCRFPGCHRTSHLEAHHIIHWLHGGPTDLNNLALLCRHHHMLMHEAGFTIQTCGGAAVNGKLELAFHRPNGTEIPTAPILSPGKTLDLPVGDISPDQILPGWRGEPFHLADAVAACCSALSALSA